jgi:hypothetical protein
MYFVSRGNLVKIQDTARNNGLLISPQLYSGKNVMERRVISARRSHKNNI